MPHSRWNKDYHYSALHVVVTRLLIFNFIPVKQFCFCIFHITFSYADIIYTIVPDFFFNYHKQLLTLKLFLFTISLRKKFQVYIFLFFKSLIE